MRALRQCKWHLEIKQPYMLTNHLMEISPLTQDNRHKANRQFSGYTSIFFISRHPWCSRHPRFWKGSAKLSMTKFIWGEHILGMWNSCPQCTKALHTLRRKCWINVEFLHNYAEILAFSMHIGLSWEIPLIFSGGCVLDLMDLMDFAFPLWGY